MNQYDDLYSLRRAGLTTHSHRRYRRPYGLRNNGHAWACTALLTWLVLLASLLSAVTLLATTQP